ncbi:MAG: hypothetical protein GEV06_28635, partial [Luteitalea sp.]|nr:hypothetical protein [Luteitalea sp.]
MATVLRDLQQGWRVLRRRPGFTAVTILTLTFGIGANVAMFSVMDGILLRPLPYRDPDRIVRLWESNAAKGYQRFEVLPGSLLDWRERSTAFEALALFRDGHLLVTSGGAPERLPVTTASTSLFRILGVKPML